MAVGALDQLKGEVHGTAPNAHRGDAFDCAKMYARIAWNKLFNPSKVAVLENEARFSPCDPFWAECLTAYTRLLALGHAQPYFVYDDIGDYVLTGCLPDDATIAVVSDWATGTKSALVLLQQIAANFKPDVLLHLGDIYYSGLPSEASRHFTNVIDQVWPEDPPLVFTLDGNHDRYAGSAGGYYPLLASLNKKRGIPQPNSYFALRNNFWQFLAMDTGYHDANPLTKSANITHLEDSEVKWHLDKIYNNGLNVDKSVNPSGVRGTVVLSHHQLISGIGVGSNPGGQRVVVNNHLAEAFAPAFPLIDFWLWGHEHNLRIFEPYSMGPGQPLPLGRCVGASAVPNFYPGSDSPLGMLVPGSETGPPQIVPGTELGNNGVVFHHSYSIIRLRKSELSIEYYQFDSTDAEVGNPPPLSAIPFRDVVEQPKAVALGKRDSGDGR